MATSQKRIDANRRNCLLSRGATTAAGREKSKMNALTHGLTAETDVVLGEDARDFAHLVEGWVVDLNPTNRVENSLVRHAARACWRLTRATHVQNARLTLHIENAATRELDEALRLGRLLFRDARGPTELYGVGAYDNKGPRTSWSGIADDPDDPGRLVRLLEATPGGLRWLEERWRELLAILVQNKVWQSHHKFKALRLLGKQPLNAADVRVVAEIFVASWAIDPRRDSAYAELKSELNDEEYDAFVTRVRAQWTDMLNAGDPEEARRVLVSIVERAIERLAGIAAVLLERAEGDLALTTASQSFDNSREGDLLRRYETSESRMMLRTLSEFAKLRKANLAAGDFGRRAEGGRLRAEDPPMDDDPIPVPQSSPVSDPIDPAITTGSRSTIENGDMTHLRNEANAGDEAVLRNEAKAGDEAVLRSEANAGDEAVLRNEANAGERVEAENSGTWKPMRSTDKQPPIVQDLGRRELKTTIIQELRRREGEESMRAGLAARVRIKRRRGGPATEQRMRNAVLRLPHDAPILTSSLPADFSTLLDEVHDELATELGNPC
jgi:hypothetical protein